MKIFRALCCCVLLLMSHVVWYVICYNLVDEMFIIVLVCMGIH